MDINGRWTTTVVHSIPREKEHLADNQMQNKVLNQAFFIAVDRDMWWAGQSGDLHTAVDRNFLNAIGNIIRYSKTIGSADCLMLTFY